MAQGIFLHEYNTGGKLYDGDVTVANNKIANKQYVIDNAALQSNNLSDLDNAGTARTNLGVAIGSDVQAYSARLGELSSLSQADGSFVVSDGTSFIFESAATARASMGVDAAGTDNSTDVNLASVSGNYLSISGQEITASTVPVSLGGTGATSASAARTALSVDVAGTDNSTDVTLAGKDFASISGQEITFAQIDLTDDVTGALPIANGGTGASSKSAAQQALDLEPGVDVQAYDAELAALAGLTSAANKIPMFSGSESATVIDFLDEDGLSSNSATAVPSQQSVKAYVEAQVQGLDIKESARVASTANVSGSYSSGVLTASSAGVLTIDGGNVALGDRVLLKDQTSGTQNGIYECTTAGTADTLAPNTSSAVSGMESTFDSATTSFDLGQLYASGSLATSYGPSINLSTGSPGYQGSTVTIPAHSAVVFTSSSGTMAYVTGSAQTITNGATYQQISFISNPFLSALSTLSSMNAADITAIHFQEVDVKGLKYIVSGSANHATTSISLSESWGGSAIAANTYIQYNNSSSNNFYWRLTAELANGASSISVAYDTDDSHTTTMSSSVYFPTSSSSESLALFNSTSGAAGASAVLTRADDFNSDADISAGAFCFVEEGTVSADAGFVLSTNEPITLDTTALTFTQFSGAGSITAGTGLTKSGNTISADGGLADIAGLAKTDGGIIVGDGSNFVLESGATARTSLGVDAAGTDNSTDVTLASVSSNYLSISGQEITAGNVPVALGGTGAASASAARSNLGVDAAGTDNSTDVTLASVSGNYLSISGQEVTAGTVPVALGGTGATSKSGAQQALDLEPGVDIQAYDAELAAIAGLTSAADKGIMFDGSASATTFDLTAAGRALLDDADAAAMRSTLGLVIGTDVAAADSSELSVNTAEPSSIAIANVNGIFVYDISSSSTSAAVTLPSTATAGCLGKSVIFKIKSTVGSGSSFTINPASSQTIDGESSIVLNQERQSIRLVVSEEYSSGSSVQCWVVV